MLKSIFDGIFSILSNQRGSIGEEGGAEADVAVEESVEEVSLSPLEQMVQTLSSSAEANSEDLEEELDEELEASSEEVEEELEEESEELENGEEAIEVQADSEEELVDELEEAKEDGASDEQLVDMVRQYTLKVNGKEYVRELDLSDDSAIERALQMEIAGRQAMQSNADIKKSYDADIESLKSDPWKVLESLGLDPLELSAKRIQDHLDQKAKSPEVIEQEKREKEHRDLKEEIERLKSEKLEEARKVEMAAAEKEIESDIISALDGDTDLEASPEVINMVVDNMLWAMKNGFEDVSAADVIPTVKAEIQKKYRAYAKSMKSTTALKSLLGDDVQSKLREERVEKVNKQVKNINNIKKTSKAKKADKEVTKKVNISDFMGGR